VRLVNLSDLKNPFIILFSILLLGVIGGTALPKIGIVVNPTSNSTSTPPTPEVVSLTDYKKVQIKVMGEQKEPLSDVDINIISGAPAKADKTNSNGYAEFQIPTQSKRVSITVSKPGFLTQSDDIDLKGDADQTKPYYLKLLEPGQVNLPGVHQPASSTSDSEKKK
jgi:hypothetical protein